MTKKQETRIDYFPDDDLSNHMERFSRRPDGYLEGEAILTNVGVFPYQLADGSIQHELRSPEEVFSRESINTLKMLPITNEHPKIAVDSSNAKELQVGHVGDRILQDQYHLGSKVLITEDAAIEEVLNGKRAFSCGYSVNLDYTSGVWMGIHYDAIQRDIRYNHAAIVSRGRAGDDVVMKFDSIDPSMGILRIDIETKKGENKMPGTNLKSIKIDGVDCEAEASVIQAYTRLEKDNEKLKNDSSKEIENLKAENIKLTAKSDQLEEEKAALEKARDEKKDVSADVIEEKVKERMVVFDSAKRAGVEIKEDMSVIEVKKAIITKVFPSTTKEKLDSMDEQYTNIRFDGVLDLLDKENIDKIDTDVILTGDTIVNKDPNKKKVTSDEAYQNMLKRDQEAWKTEGEE